MKFSTSVLFAAFSALLLLTACKKDSPIRSATDYRDGYVGNYHSHKLCIESMPGLGVSRDTTFNDNVTIVVSKDPNSSNKIVVDSKTVTIDNSGNYYYGDGLNQSYSVSFKNDSVFIKTFYGSINGGTYCETKGKKQ